MKIREHISWQEVNSKIFIFDERNSHIIKLEGAACKVWKDCILNNNQTTYIQESSSMLDVELCEVLSDLNEFLENLIEFEVIDIEIK